MTEHPDFHELVGDDVDAEERDRLERVHELLVAAGPPPELPPALLEPDAEPTGHHVVRPAPAARRSRCSPLAAAIALVAFVGGFAVGQQERRRLQRRGTVDDARHAGGPERARRRSRVGERDDERQLAAEARRPQPARAAAQARYYEMFLTRNGKPAATCGTFARAGKTVTVRLNAPYNLTPYDGWVVTRHVRRSNAAAGRAHDVRARSV